VNYREWKEKAVLSAAYSGLFWEIIDRNWTPEQQNKLAREWKEGTPL
jgi:hypothetical protein